MAKFLNGFMVKEAHPNSPDFIKCKVSINIPSITEAFAEFDNEWINLDIKRSKEGKLYAQVDEWKPESSEEGEASGDDVPF